MSVHLKLLYIPYLPVLLQLISPDIFSSARCFSWSRGTPLWTATLSQEKNSSKKNCLFQHILKGTLHSVFHATSCTSKELIFRDVHFHNSGKPYQFTEKHLHFQQEFSIWNIISYFSNIFGNWESVIIDEKSLGKFTGEIFNVHYYFAPKPN